MSAHPSDMRHNLHDHAPGYRAIRWNMDWILRPLFGIVLAGVAIGALFLGARSFAILVALIAALAAFEWHRIVARGKPYRLEAAVTAVTVALSSLALAFGAAPGLALGLVVLGLLSSAFLAARRHDAWGWQALGVVYLAIPSLALVALRALTGHNGHWIVIGLFIIVWATDTGALIFGNLIGGPRLAPALSPAKTWAGTIGGSLTAGLAFAALIGLLGGVFWPSFAFAFGLSFVAHGGDLFESFVKRRFGIKDSGGLIPGHGGVLDRMDSTLAAAVALAALVFLAHFNPLIGVNS